MFAVTAGHSLAYGSTAVEDVLTNAAVYPSKALALNFGSPYFVNKGFNDKPVPTQGFLGFTALREYDFETPMSSMVNRIIYEYNQAGETAPTIAAFNTSSPGKSILTLMTKGSEVFKSVAAGLSSSQIGVGDVFAVNLNTPDQKFAYYKKTSATTSSYYGTYESAPVMFDNYVKQLQLGYNAAVAAGYQVDSKLVFSWIHGEIDQNLADHEYLFNKLIQKFETAAEAIYGRDVQLVLAVSQSQDTSNANIPIDQLEMINARQDTILGAPLYQSRVLYPSRALVDYDHLSSQGYYMLGQQIGSNIFDKLAGNENTPIVISSVTANSPTQMIVKFSGLIGNLVNDVSAYKASNYLHAPADMGFRLYAQNGDIIYGPEITSAKIVGSNAVQLDFSAPINGPYRLYLGRSDEILVNGGSYNYGLAGTTLRDSAFEIAQTPKDPTNKLTDAKIYDFAPVQYININFTGNQPGPDAPPQPEPQPQPVPGQPGQTEAIIFTGGPVAEDSAIGSMVGAFSDPDGTIHTYELVKGKGSDDNRLVSIVGNVLVVNRLINFEDDHTLNVRVRSTDATGNYVERKFIIAVTDVQDTNATDQGDFLAGSRSKDKLRGLGGDDVIKGYSGADIVNGGLGNDTLLGGAGADKFMFRWANHGFDYIADFNEKDMLVFEGSQFGLGGYEGSMPEDSFRSIEAGTPVALDDNDRFVYRQSDNQLWFDPDGNGVERMRQIAVLNDVDLTANDILVI
jgi:Ca2+-binding RTX toxin-like protein